MGTLGIPVETEKSEIGSAVNTVNLLMFLMGMYTILYFGTIYIYLTKNSSKNHIVLAAITILYASSIVGTAIQWWQALWEFVNNGDTRDSIFLSIYECPPWSVVVFDASQYIVCVIADGLLIWRCFFVWNRSLRIISVPLVLIITEATLFLVDMVFHIMFTNATLSQGNAQTMNNVLFAAFFVSFFTTLVTTTLIAYRIYSASKDGGIPTKRFKHIIDILVQSGAVYALTMLVTAIGIIVDERGSAVLTARIAAFDDYIQTLCSPIAGILATIMVARVALISQESPSPSAVVHVSGLQFRAHSTRQTGTIGEADRVQSVDVENIAIVEEQ